MHLSRFLLRWLYINKLIRDRTEIQSIPYTPPVAAEYQHGLDHRIISSSFEHNSPDLGSRPFQNPNDHYVKPPRLNEHTFSSGDLDEEWKIRALHGIASYPPGVSRLLALDAIRLEIVHDLAKAIHEADLVIEASDDTLGGIAINIQEKAELKASSDRKISSGKLFMEDKDDVDDPYIDEDKDIIRRFERDIFQRQKMVPSEQAHTSIEGKYNEESSKPLFFLSTRIRHENMESSDSRIGQEHVRTILPDQINQAKVLLQELSDALPQLISLSLHSSAAVKHSSLPHLDPLIELRKFLIDRCVRDPNLGIKVCWLLEAEVGRAWKTLFEHRQQTGRRLIVVLPAEKAAVIAKIGIEKKHAFDLLQDVESATAFGFYDEEENFGEGWGEPMDVLNDFHSNTTRACHGTEDKNMGARRDGFNVPRLPASLSMRRCRHFGDTMHFIDRMTKISLHLRTIPHIHRTSSLILSLEDLNRRLRRRMVSRGMITIDEEDNREPYDWPTRDDLTVDMVKYSIHFPLDPKTVVWPSGQNVHDSVDKQKIVRVLNIVTNECRILSSRERCPFLVVCEVVDTTLSGNDVRLFASGADNIGTTIREALGSLRSCRRQSEEVFTPTMIPHCLIEPDSTSYDVNFSQQHIVTKPHINSLPRGGWQGNGEEWYHDGVSPFEMIREEQLEELHNQLSSQRVSYSAPSTTSATSTPYIKENSMPYTKNEALLQRVFGIHWSQKCKEIQLLSPFGHLKGWRIASFIMKAGEDVRREALVMQVISKLKDWFDYEISPRNRPYLRPYTIMCVGGDSGLVECVKDAKSIDEVKKETDGFLSLRDYFERAYSHHSSDSTAINFVTAQDNFLRSLVGYSLVCYILQIKDRHNANILLDRDGHMMHIDFGFVMGETPKMAKVPLFSERAPFKLTAEFWEVIGGWNLNQGGLGVRFCRMFEEAFECASRHAGDIGDTIEAAFLSLSRHPLEAKYLADEVRQRLRMRGPRNSVMQKTFIMDLVNTALTSWGTSTYDWLQKSMNGYI